MESENYEGNLLSLPVASPPVTRGGARRRARGVGGMSPPGSNKKGGRRVLAPGGAGTLWTFLFLTNACLCAA